ncbi:FlgD immunoglobulin-like domain containing protein [bacterium]
MCHFDIVILVFIYFFNVFPHKVFPQHVIEINSSYPSPRWAVLEQELLSENLEFLELVTAKYINPITGHLECVEHWGGADGPDDAMENFYNWSLLYALGAHIRTLEIFNFIWNGHIDQYTNSEIRDPRGSQAYYKEFISAFDWEHTGEGIAPFLLLPLSDPDDSKTKERVNQFADFYTGRDTSTHNYDPIHKIIKSVFNGSRGPWLSASPEQINLNNNSWRSRGSQGVMGDVPLNLISTSLAVNAYMLTGDEHYKNWVIEYTSAWLQRTIDNHGMIPSNVGLNGIVGEHWENKWYGGIMGWDWNFGGFRILGRGMRIGFGNGYFLSKNSQFLEALREQGELLIDVKTTFGEQSNYLNNFGDAYWFLPLNAPVANLTSWYGRDRSNDNWYDRRSMTELKNHFTDLYMWSLEQHDLQRIYDTSPTQSRDWINFLKGENPDYPETALEGEFSRLEMQTRQVIADATTPSERYADHGPWPAATSALVNLTLGGLQPTKSGGLLYCQLRYFNPIEKRPGLPPDIGALIQSIDSAKVIVTLVNIDPSESREIIVQTGAYGEHQCSKIMIADHEYQIDNNYFHVKLAPATGSELSIYLNRNLNTPSLQFPWQRNSTYIERISGNADHDENQIFIQIMPNPFNSITTVQYDVQYSSNIKMILIDINGCLIRNLVNGVHNVGSYSVTWDGKNNKGMMMPSGTYICKCLYQDKVQTSKLIFLK